jgi:hypothetical protein
LKIGCAKTTVVPEYALPIRSSIAIAAIGVMPRIMADPKHSRRPRDPNQLAKLITDIATGQAEPMVTDDGRDLAAVLMGRRGGIKGGRVRAERLSPERRREIAQQAAAARWSKK